MSIRTYICLCTFVVFNVCTTCITTRFIVSHILPYIGTHIHAFTHEHTHTHTHTHARARTHTHAHTHIHARARTHTNTHTHTHTRTHTHAHAYFHLILSLALFFICMYRFSRHGWISDICLFCYYNVHDNGIKEMTVSKKKLSTILNESKQIWTELSRNNHHTNIPPVKRVSI